MTRGVPLSSKIKIVVDSHSGIENILDFLQYGSTRHTTIPVESIIEVQGSRLLLVDIPKLGDITPAQPVNDMLIGLESQVVAVS
jgi:hypothetical protein